MMRKFALALVALLSLTSAGYAAFAIFQTYTTPQVFYNIVTDAGASCNGNVQVVTRTISINTGTKNLNTVGVNTFAPADAGKTIGIPLAGPGGNTPLTTTIASYVDAQNVILTSAPTALSSVSRTFAFGTDDAVAFKTFNTWALANQGSNQVVLTIPNGSSCWLGSSQLYASVGSFNAFASGINNLIVEGTGATLSAVSGGGLNLGAAGVCGNGLTDPSGCSARINSTSPGDTVITLTPASVSAGYMSRFSVGDFIQPGGLDTQGLFISGYGFPPNETYFEWRQIVSCNASPTVCTGSTITLDRPLTKTILSTWPSYNTGTSGQSDQGGPATIWRMNAAWNARVEYRGLTIATDSQTNGNIRYLTYRNVTFPGTGQIGNFPSQNEEWTAISSTWSGINMEVDKLVGTVTMDGVSIGQLVFQSNSVDRLVMSNSTVFGAFTGGAKQNTITDVSMGSWTPGSYNYGNSPGPTVCTRCNVGTWAYPGGVASNPNPSPYSMSGGVIQVSISQAPAGQAWASPIGNLMHFGVPSGQYATIGAFSVQGITADPWPALDNQSTTTTISIANLSKNLNVPSAPFVSGDVGKTIIVNGAGPANGQLRTYITTITDAANVVLFNAASTAVVAASQTVQWGTSNLYVQTNQAGGFPPTTNFGGGPIAFVSNGAPSFTCDACTGDAALVASNVQRGATALAPMMTFSSRDFAPTGTFKNTSPLVVRGKLVSLTVDVTIAFVGPGTAVINPTGEFHNFTVDQSGWTVFDWFPTINLKQTGTRVITPGGVTCNGGAGGCAGDTINSTNGYPPNAVWVRNGLDPSLPNTLAGGSVFPIFNITAKTDQTP